MGFKKGISANIKIPAGNKTGEIDRLSQVLSKVKGGFQVGRVTDIILNPNFPNIDDYGGLNGIGTIFFELNQRISSKNSIALPFFPNTSSYPLVNELVLLFKLPNNAIGNNTSNTSYYYINMIGLWNHPHHNAYPNPITSTTLPEPQQKDYQQTQAGNVRRITDESSEVDFNSPTNPSQNTFIERSNIHPLLPFSGDIIYEGRWGNSIRLGSTAKPTLQDALNDWSDVGENGNPITIFRNGQPLKSSNEGWVPIVERVNDDLSSIYLTSNQKIPIGVSNSNYSSFSSKPILPSEFTDSQVIINSDRLVFNSKSDSILLSAQKSIFLGSNSSISLSTKDYTVDSPQIKLGKGATESIIKGDKFLDDLSSIMNELSILCTQLSKLKEVSAVDVNSGKIVYTSAVKGEVSAVAKNLKGMIDDYLIPQIKSPTGYKSNVSKTL